MSELALKLIAQNKEKHRLGEDATSLIIGNCGLTKLPEELFECEWLEELIVSDLFWDFDKSSWAYNSNEGEENIIHFIPKDIKFLKKLKTLQIGGSPDKSWQIEDISPITTLTKLQTLNLSYNQIADITPMKELNSLKTLDLGTNPIVSIDALASVKTLVTLYLSNNKIENLDPISALIELNYLYVIENPITEINSVASLKKLKKLNLNSCRIQDINPITTLTSLKELYLIENEITNIDAIVGLKELRTLNLSGNRVRDIGPLAPLKRLTQLYLANNQISDLVPISELIKLKRLYISSNQITDITPIAKLTELDNVRLGNNNVATITADFLQKINLKLLVDDAPDEQGIFLNDNPISDPPLDVLAQGREFAIEYLKSVDKKPLNECKVILIGQGGVGKTTLQKRIMGEAIDRREPKTHGIRKISWNDGIKSINGENIRVNFWDFGGQHIQRALHQFFYSKNTLYILVLDGRKEDAPEDFLELVRGYGANSSIIMVYNYRTEDGHDYDLEPKLDSTLLNKYPNIKKVVGVNCGEDGDEGVNNLRKYLQDFIPFQEHVRELYPGSWLTIKANLLEQVGTDYLLYNQYLSICKKYGLQEENIQKGLAEMLATVGTITFFNRPFGDNYYILNPDWLTTGAYQIILSEVTVSKNGRIDMADLRKIFSEKLIFKYSQQDVKILLELMSAFDLCHKFSFREEWLIPSSLEGLSKSNLVKFRGRGTSRYAIRYPVALPASVIHRFIVRNIGYAHEEDYWRNGIVVKHPNSDTLMYVEADPKDKEIRLYIKGQMIVECWDYFRKDFKELSEKFEYQELVVLESGESISYQYLIAARRAGLKEVFVEKAGMINIKEILGRFEKSEGRDQDTDLTEENTRQHNEEKLKIFVSYAQSDNEFGQVDLFVKELSLQLPADKYKIFKEDQIIIGEKWHDRLRKEVTSADIAILLLSPAFLNSNYISEHELKTFIEKNKLEKNILCPLFFDVFDLVDYPEISQYQFFAPSGHDYGDNYAKFEKLRYGHLIEFHPTDGRILPNAARSNYISDFAKRMKEAIQAHGMY